MNFIFFLTWDAKLDRTFDREAKMRQTQMTGDNLIIDFVPYFSFRTIALGENSIFGQMKLKN